MKNLCKKIRAGNCIVCFYKCNVFIFKSFLQLNGFEIRFLLIANAILLILSLSGFFYTVERIEIKQRQCIYTECIFVVAAENGYNNDSRICLYVYNHGKVNTAFIVYVHGNIPAVYIIEVTQLMKIARRKPDA
jgi:hypothetical protein